MALEPAFDTQMVVLGVSGIDLHHAIDQIPPTKLQYMQNAVRNNVGELTGAPAGTVLFNTGDTAEVHSLGRLDDPRTGNFIRLVGDNQFLGTIPPTFEYRLLYGTTGPGLTLIDTGWSGDPLTFLPYRPPQSGDTWMFVGDSVKMRKVNISGVALQIGLPAPGAFAVLPAPAAATTTTIDTCEAAGWTNNAGTGAGAPANAVDNVNFKAGTASVQFTTNIGAAPAVQYQYWNKANALDLSLVGALPADDDDQIHVWIRIDRPDLITEMRIYFVCSSAFNTATLPGTSTTLNTEAYVKAFRPSDFMPVDEASATTTPTAGTVNSTTQTMQQLQRETDRRASVQVVEEELTEERFLSRRLVSGRGTWTEFGSVGIPFRRGEFRRIGSDTTRGWQNVTGLVVMVVQTPGAPTNTNLWLDDIYLYGGYGPDNAAVGDAGYDYRYTNYDPRTGAESNPSGIMDEANWIDVVRGQVVVTPNAFGDANIRQRIYRRGGKLKNNWYFVAVNTADGAAYSDGTSDAALLAASTLEIDNDQPVTTVDNLGATVLAEPLPAIWGPVQEILFGCGDPYRPGYVYWSKSGKPDSWPAANNVEVCSASEEMMTGVVWGGQSFGFSRLRMYSLIPNVAAPGVVTSVPTACQHGMVNRWAVCTGPQGIYFVSNDGIYVTQGGQERLISDDIRSVFHGETRLGVVPVNFTDPNHIRLTFHDNELYFHYQSGVLVYHTLYDYWRVSELVAGGSTATAVSYSEMNRANPKLSLLAGTRIGAEFVLRVTPDDSALGLESIIRTPAFDQGFPRQDKLYGDLILDLDRGGNTLLVTCRVNNDVTALAAQSITTGSGRTRYVLDPFGTGPQQARNISVGITWTNGASAPVFYSLGISYIVQPDTTVGRVTEWSAEGRRIDKWIKGLILECDTGGATKTLQLQADGVTQTTISAVANGRRVLQYPAVGSTWTPFRGRLLRIVPTDANNWKEYGAEWIFDEEPLQLLRWETQEVDHGIPTHQALLAGYITLVSTAAVTLTITGVRQTGATFSDAYTIASTAGLKLKPFVPFNARKAVLWKYLFTSAAPFWLYQEESEVIVQPWGGAPTTAKPFGNSDFMPRNMASSALTALASGGGQRNS